MHSHTDGGSNLGFSILLKDTSTCRLQGRPLYPLSHRRPQVDSVSSRSLFELIEEEVRENVDSALSSSLSTAQTLLDQHVIPPHKLTTMVDHASKMLKESTAKKKTLFSPQPHKKRKEGFILEDMKDSTDQEPSDSDDGCQSSDSDDGRQSSNSLETHTLQEEIRKGLSDIITPLLDEVPDSEYKKLQSEISLQLQTLSDDISPLICIKEKKRRPFKLVRNKIKSFFAKCFAKVWMHRLLEQLKKKHQQHTDVESNELAESLVDSVKSRLHIDEQEDGNEDSLMLWFRNMSSDKVLVFTKELSDLISRHFLPEVVPESIMGKQTLRKRAAPESHADMCADIRSKVWIFVVLMNWWLKTEVKRLSERVKLPIMDNVPLPNAAENAASKREKTQQEAALQTEKNKTFVKVVIEKVLWKVYCDVKVLPEDRCDITNRLFESVWAGVKGADLEITPDSIKYLSKTIYKELCKKWGNPDHVLFLLELKDPAIDKYIVTVFQLLLTIPPTKPNAICRFFSSVGKVLSRPFRRRHKDSVWFLEMLDSC